MDAETSHIPGNTKTREATTTDKLGLVIGGGGSVGIAWEIGILKALESAGVSLRSIPIVIGT
ncbi:MAG: hypothetical protein LBU61_01510, partial [Coriobacteriales bacterium]|nr:hypothetical protein [Coriobacteriales bacterium]